jgi:trimethylamine--corrinoid protein Co-methyltransferase
LGYLESGLTGSLGLLVFCDEIIGWIRRFMGEIEVNRETLALDVIDEVGPDGHFIDCDHTFRHFRKDWYPTLIDRQNYEGWYASGSKTLNDRANEKVDEILNRSRPDHLPKQIVRKIRAIVDQVT